MALPRIQSYALPSEDEIPCSLVSWTIDPSRAAFLVHDMQHYFVSAFPQGAAPIDSAIRNIARIRKACEVAGVPVFFTAQAGDQLPADRGLQADFWGAGMKAAAAHQDIIEPLAPAPGDIVLEKWRYSAFQRTNLETLLRARGRDQLIVSGVFAQIGCLLTAADAFMRDVQPFYVADAVAAYTREMHAAALAYVSGCCGVVLTTDAVIAALEKT